MFERDIYTIHSTYREDMRIKGFQFGIQFLVVLHLETPFFFGALGGGPQPPPRATGVGGGGFGEKFLGGG